MCSVSKTTLTTGTLACRERGNIHTQSASKDPRVFLSFFLLGEEREREDTTQNTTGAFTWKKKKQPNYTHTHTLCGAELIKEKKPKKKKKKNPTGHFKNKREREEEEDKPLWKTIENGTQCSIPLSLP